MDVAAAGQMIIFFSLLVAMILVGSLVLAYIGYSFIHVLISTAAGNDRVSWPGDPLFDWLFKGWYLAWIAVMSALPAALVIAIGRIHANDPRWAIALASSVCLCFPIFLLSSTSGPSRLLIVRGEILAGFLGRLGLTIVFYVLSALVVVGSSAFLWYSIVEWPVAVVPLAMITLAIGILIYARMLGRLGHAITEEPESPQDRKKQAGQGKRVASKWGVPELPLPHDKAPRSRPATKKPRAKKPKSNAIDPWAIPELESKVKPVRKRIASDDPLGPSEGGYDVESATKKAAASPARESKSSKRKNEQDTYDMAPNDPGPEIEPVPRPALPEVSSYEAALAAPKQRPALPANPMLSGVLAFPFYPTSLGPLCTMAIGLTVLGLLARGLMSLYPA
jgi:hypothetical protein